MRILLPFAAALAACSSAPGTIVSFDLTADLTQQAHFYDFPYPSDLRLNATGGPDMTGFLNPRNLDLVSGLAQESGERAGFPVVPVAYFQFSAPLAARDSPDDVIAAAATSPILLVDVDPASPERGRLFPTVSVTPPADDFVPNNLLAIAPRPGFVLTGKRAYAFVVLRALGDAKGARLGVAPTLDTLAHGGTPPGARGAAAAQSFAPLWTTLKQLNIDSSQVAAATVFTTGDVVADTAQLAESLRAKYSVQITGLAVNYPNGGDQQTRFCELTGTVTYPQFQSGTPPFDSGGRFQFTDNGLPAKQRDEVAPMVVTLPFGTMPSGGYPLVVYFHGSGGVSTEVVDRGTVMVAGGPEQPGHGPSFVLAPFNIATAGSAMPVNPQRLPGATEIAYLNFNNLPAFRDTFRQGVIEQRLFIEALRTLTIPASTVATQCPGLQLPAGETAFHFNANQLIAQGQSMGGMYANLISAVEPRIRAVVPTGAGGYWSLFILKTTLIPNAANAVASILGSDQLTFMHPAMSLLETAWEPADPFVYMPRVARRPLAGAPVRPIYEPVGKDDSYFPTVLYDAIALSYGHQEAGDVVWPTMQQALALDHLDGILPYPVKQNRMSSNNAPYTGVVVQYMGDGIYDPHAIAFQLDSVKYQYGCFVSTFLASGVATVPAPAALGTPCPQ
jgi:hypothetical protein